MTQNFRKNENGKQAPPPGPPFSQVKDEGRAQGPKCTIHTFIHTYILIITGVQASVVIIDRLLRQCCFVWSEIVGPHSSGNFND